jgi:hypothetical protein
MAQFLADIAGMLEVFGIATGLVLLHRASKEAPAKLLKAAGWVLVVGGISVGLFDSTHMGYSERMQHSDMAPGMMRGRP